MSYLEWHVGMKVVAVDAESAPWRAAMPPVSSRGEKLVTAGSVYTIRSIMTIAGDVWIHVKEVANKPLLYNFPDGVTRFMECPFEARYFRPVQTRKTDISVFTALLNPSPADKAEIDLADFVYEHSTPMQDEPFR